MANTIVLKRSAVPGKVPATTDLSLGEIAVNTYDGKLYIKRNAGSDSIVEMMRADFSNVNGLSTGILCGVSGSPQYRSIASGDAAITVTNANGSTGNPTVTFQPGNVALVNLAGTLALNKGGTGATTQNAAANAILPAQSTNSGKFLTTNGTDSSWADVSASPAGSTGQVQYNNAGATAGATNITVSATGNMILKSAASDTPTGTDLVVFNEVNFPSGLSTRNSYGVGTSLQRTVGNCEIGWWNPPGNATTAPGVLGIAAPTAVGTGAVRNIALTNILTRARRLGYNSAATTSAVSGQYWTAAQYAMGNGSGLGGFYLNYRFGVSDTTTLVSTASMFCGMSTLTSVPASINPATALNWFGVGHASGDTNYTIYYGGSAAQTPINLGANFPVTITDLYELSLYVPNNVNNVVYYKFKRLGTAFEATGTLTGTAGVALPASSALLAPRIWRSNNGTAAVVAIDVAHFYTETQQY